MSTIVTRAGKGSALTWTEGDANITNLNNDKIEAVVDDTTPQLGGNLDVNGNSIVSASNGNIAITPNGTGQIVLGSTTLTKYKETIYTGGSQSSAYTPNWTNGSIQTVTLTGAVTFAAPTNMVAGSSLTLILTQDGTGGRTGTWNASYKFAGGTPVLSTTAAAVDIVNIFYDGTNYLASLSKQDSQSTVTGLIISAQGELRLADSDSSNYVGFKSPATVSANKVWTLPSADGTSGQLLSTDGAGALSWTTPSSGGTNVIVLSTPSLTQPNTTSASFSNVWTIRSSGGISGVSVSGSNNDITLPAGTWLFELEAVTSTVTTAATDFRLYNNTDSDVLGEITNAYTVTYGGATRYRHGKLACVYTIASGSKAIGFYNGGSAPASAYTWTQRPSTSFSGGSATTFGVVMRITKLS